MQNLYNYFVSLISAGVAYIIAAVRVLTSNTWLMVGSLFLLLTVGKSLKIGNALQYKSK